eukprot:TRINITY_DN23254_c0_g6_i1.p1 TRINITY_DN23254_c0_g6~~TRINITY_DN23254_c0_g6_i1.p1  ORF type:complete len:185 (+),score=11.86 TRINITY_DN23254_c0_g6_i1:78-557(+)
MAPFRTVAYYSARWELPRDSPVQVLQAALVGKQQRAERPFSAVSCNVARDTKSGKHFRRRCIDKSFRYRVILRDDSQVQWRQVAPQPRFIFGSTLGVDSRPSLHASCNQQGSPRWARMLTWNNLAAVMRSFAEECDGRGQPTVVCQQGTQVQRRATTPS